MPPTLLTVEKTTVAPLGVLAITMIVVEGAVAAPVQKKVEPYSCFCSIRLCADKPTFSGSRKRRRSPSPYDRDRFDPRPRYGDDYGMSFLHPCSS